MNPFFDRFLDGVEGIPRHFITHALIAGKWRLLYKPNEAMAEVQKRIRKFLRGCAPKFHSSYSKKGGGGAVKNARKHQALYRFKLDIKNAFSTTPIERLVPVIAHRVHYMTGCGVTPEEWLEFLRQYAISKEGTLPEGACTSSSLFDWYCEVFLDRQIRACCSHWRDRVKFSRFADDMMLSSDWPIGRIRKRKVVRKILQSAGFKENCEKSVYVKGRSSVQVTGSYVNGSRVYSIGVSRAWLKDTERMLYQANVIGVSECGHVPSVIQGKVQYLLDVLRGRREGLTTLEKKVLTAYIQYADKTGQDSIWAQNTIAKKGKNET